MKKKRNFMVLALVAIILLFVFDYVLVLTTHSKPLLAIRRSDSLNLIYTTPFYRVWKCYNGTNHIGTFGDSFDCPKIVGSFVIVDETKNCAEALELFYSDDYYDYYFPCIQSNTVFIKLINDKKITVKDALANNIVTINELKDAGLFFYKYSKFEIETNLSNTCKIKQLIAYNKTYRIPLNYNLFSYCLDDIVITIDNMSYPLKEALTTGKITLDRLINKMNYDSIYGNVIKMVAKDGGSTLYSSNDFSLLKCNTIAGNRDYYVGSRDMKYENNFCK
jgi:hypothetical protein